MTGPIPQIQPHEMPSGTDYQWVTFAVLGDESLSQVPGMKERGWQEVPLSRHPALPGNDLGHIVFGGLILMERPVEASQRAQAADAEKSRQNVEDARNELIRLLSA